MRESIPDLTEEAVEVVEPKPPPVPPHPAKRRRSEPTDGRVSLVDFDRVASSHPPPVHLSTTHYYHRPMWASRVSWLRTPTGEVVFDGVPPYLAYATSALVGVILAVSLFLGLM